MCDDGWDTADATVVCRQLGLSTTSILDFKCDLIFSYNPFVLVVGSTAVYFELFGQGSGSIILNNVECTGSEARLVECPSGRITSCSCNEDAGVRCLALTGYNPFMSPCSIANCLMKNAVTIYSYITPYLHS